MLDTWWFVAPFLVSIVVSARLHRHRDQLGTAWEVAFGVTIAGLMVAATVNVEAIAMLFVGLHVLVVVVGAWRVWGRRGSATEEN